MSVAAASRDLAEQGARAVTDLGLGSILESAAVRRLDAISFLGVLRRDSFPRHSRLNHSLGAVYLATRAGRAAQLPHPLLRHLAAALLLHDVSTWPLSHTGEEPFKRITGLSNGSLKHAVLYDEPTVPAEYHLGQTLADAALDRAVLWVLLSKKASGADAVLDATVELVRCVANPDTLDGIARSALIYSVECPDVTRVADRFRYHDQQLCVAADVLPLLDEFWTAKAQVYARHIYAPASIEGERLAAEALYATYAGTSPRDALALTDEAVLQRIEPLLDGESGLRSAMELRFRPHQRYRIDTAVAFDEDPIPVTALTQRYAREDLD